MHSFYVPQLCVKVREQCSCIGLCCPALYEAGFLCHCARQPRWPFSFWKFCHCSQMHVYWFWLFLESSGDTSSHSQSCSANDFTNSAIFLSWFNLLLMLAPRNNVKKSSHLVIFFRVENDCLVPIVLNNAKIMIIEIGLFYFNFVSRHVLRISQQLSIPS